MKPSFGLLVAPSGALDVSTAAFISFIFYISLGYSRDSQEALLALCLLPHAMLLGWRPLTRCQGKAQPKSQSKAQESDET